MPEVKADELLLETAPAQSTGRALESSTRTVAVPPAEVELDKLLAAAATAVQASVSSRGADSPLEVVAVTTSRFPFRAANSSELLQLVRDTLQAEDSEAKAAAVGELRHELSQEIADGKTAGLFVSRYLLDPRTVPDPTTYSNLWRGYLANAARVAFPTPTRSVRGRAPQLTLPTMLPGDTGQAALAVVKRAFAAEVRGPARAGNVEAISNGFSWTASTLLPGMLEFEDYVRIIGRTSYAEEVPEIDLVQQIRLPLSHVEALTDMSGATFEYTDGQWEINSRSKLRAFIGLLVRYLFAALPQAPFIAAKVAFPLGWSDDDLDRVSLRPEVDPHHREYVRLLLSVPLYAETPPAGGTNVSMTGLTGSVATLTLPPVAYDTNDEDAADFLLRTLPSLAAAFPESMLNLVNGSWREVTIPYGGASRRSSRGSRTSSASSSSSSSSSSRRSSVAAVGYTPTPIIRPVGSSPSGAAIAIVDRFNKERKQRAGIVLASAQSNEAVDIVVNARTAAECQVVSGEAPVNPLSSRRCSEQIQANTQNAFLPAGPTRQTVLERVDALGTSLLRDALTFAPPEVNLSSAPSARKCLFALVNHVPGAFRTLAGESPLLNIPSTTTPLSLEACAAGAKRLLVRAISTNLPTASIRVWDISKFEPFAAQPENTLREQITPNSLHLRLVVPREFVTGGLRLVTPEQLTPVAATGSSLFVEEGKLASFVQAMALGLIYGLENGRGNEAAQSIEAFGLLAGDPRWKLRSVEISPSPPSSPWMTVLFHLGFPRNPALFASFINAGDNVRNLPIAFPHSIATMIQALDIPPLQLP